MAGVARTTLCAELNRLAQGGSTYTRPYLEEAGAANKWASTSGYTVEGALNVKASTRGLGLRAVCNKLASTTDLDPVSALRTIAS